MQKFLVFISLILSTHIGISQTVRHCATDEIRANAIAQNPELAKLEEQANKTIASHQAMAYAKKANGIIYIPVVFHIIHNDGLENISQAQLMDAIKVLNNDYRRKAGTTGFSSDPASDDLEIEFRLAQYDPSGKKSDGINRIKSTLTDSATDAVKALSYWDSNKFLNVWVVKTISSASIGGQGIILGYAQFPWDRNSKPTTDGVVIRSDQMGTIGTADAGQIGRTFTHEVGHWLGLYHTFQGGCAGGTVSDCASQGDRVCDTPPVANSNSGCSVGINSCTNDVPDMPDMIRNYMDYSDGTCMNTFTTGQKTRVYSSMASYRNTIYGSGANNVTYAGIDPSAGTYTVVTASIFKAPYTNDFENNPLTTGKWKLNNFNNSANGWQLHNSIAESGTSSMFMHNFINTNALVNGRDGFQSPEIDITTVATPILEFYYAYAQKSSVNSDSLILFLSNDFGMNETRIFGQRGADLATHEITTSEYIPTQAEWRKVTFNLANYKGTNTRLRFEFFNRRGNNIYVDNFSIVAGVVGIGEEAKQEISFNAFPNPMHSNTTLSFELKQSDAVTILLTDIMGRTVSVIENGTLEAGKHEVIVPNIGLSSGMYFIDFKSTEATFTHKLLVN
jgi:hypothetical protein